MGKTARDRRTWERAKANGYKNSDKASDAYWKWAKTFNNVKVQTKEGFWYWACRRPVLIKNGGKP